jgi:hypothetical protein
MRTLKNEIEINDQTLTAFTSAQSYYTEFKSNNCSKSGKVLSTSHLERFRSLIISTSPIKEHEPF